MNLYELTRGVFLGNQSDYEAPIEKTKAAFIKQMDFKKKKAVKILEIGNDHYYAAPSDDPNDFIFLLRDAVTDEESVEGGYVGDMIWFNRSIIRHSKLCSLLIIHTLHHRNSIDNTLYSDDDKKVLGDAHEYAVIQAVRRGIDVNHSVLNDYKNNEFVQNYMKGAKVPTGKVAVSHADVLARFKAKQADMERIRRLQEEKEFA